MSQIQHFKERIDKLEKSRRTILDRTILAVTGEVIEDIVKHMKDLDELIYEIDKERKKTVCDKEPSEDAAYVFKCSDDTFRDLGLHCGSTIRNSVRELHRHNLSNFERESRRHLIAGGNLRRSVCTSFAELSKPWKRFQSLIPASNGDVATRTDKSAHFASFATILLIESLSPKSKSLLAHVKADLWTEYNKSKKRYEDAEEECKKTKSQLQKLEKPYGIATRLAFRVKHRV